MRRWYSLVPILLLAVIAGCGGDNNVDNNVGLMGYWNVAMYANGSQTAIYVFGLAMSQEGSNYSGSSVAYDGSVPVPSNMCINANTLRATATTSGNNYTMTITDTSSNTVITATGQLETNGATTLTGNYNNAASATCPASSGTLDMVPQ
jgi:hypothetical protein